MGNSRVRLFPRTSRVSIDSASFREAGITTRPTGRARGLTGYVRQDILLCSDFSEHTRPPRSAGGGAPALARLSHQVSLACTPATGDPVAIGKWSVPRPVRTKSAQGQKGGDISSHVRCHQDTRNTLMRASQARESNATALYRAANFFFYTYIYILFYLYTLYMRRFTSILQARNF